MQQSPKNESAVGRTSRLALDPLLRLSPIPMLRIHRGCLADLNEAAMLLLDWDTGRIGLPIESLSEVTLDAERMVARLRCN